MKRLLRRGYHAMSLISLMLCIAAAVMWVRSYRFNEWLCWTRMNPRMRTILEYDAVSESGSISVHLDTLADGNQTDYDYFVEGQRNGFRYLRDVPDFSDAPDYSVNSRPDPAPILGFLFVKHPSARDITLIVPYWSLPAITGLLPIVWATGRIRALRVRRRQRKGLCRHCGYDVRFSGDRCPECGALISAGADQGRR